MQTATVFNHETVYLDGDAFEGCEFRDCRLVYSGGEPPAFRDCKFHDCDWKFEDAAANTLGTLKAVWGVGGKTAVQSMIKDITGGGGR